MNITIHCQIILSRTASFIVLNHWAVGIIPGRVTPGCPMFIRNRADQVYTAGPLVLTGWIPKCLEVTHEPVR